VAERKNYPLRLAPEVYEALRRWAEDDLRSVNAQIEFLLACALRDAGRAPKGGPHSPGPSLPEGEEKTTKAD
jgi:hypothetical protein